MTGIPDAETAWQKHPYSEPDGPAVDLAHAGFLAGFAAAEGPWREHLATQTCCPCPRHSHQCTYHCQEDAR